VAAASEASKSLILDICNIFLTEHDNQRFKAVCRKLAAFGITDFTPRLRTMGSAVVIESNPGVLCNGTYAVVDSVKVGCELYARKSSALPCFRQQPVRETIQNEISAVRPLNHPYIIRIFFTCEEDARFFIIMEPLADCDLESFLYRYSSRLPSESQKIMV
jgi:serine/threonine protein kinase